MKNQVRPPDESVYWTDQLVGGDQGFYQEPTALEEFAVGILDKLGYTDSPTKRDTFSTEYESKHRDLPHPTWESRTFADAVKDAAKSRRPILLYVNHQGWNSICDEFEANCLSDKNFNQLIKHYQYLCVGISKETKEGGKIWE